jgi:hypothetical protein
MSHSCIDVVIQTDSGAANELIMQIPRMWISETCIRAFYPHHASKMGVYTSLEWVTHASMLAFKVIQIVEMSSSCKYLAYEYHKHVHPHSTCMIQVRRMYIPHWNQSLMRQYCHSMWFRCRKWPHYAKTSHMNITNMYTHVPPVWCKWEGCIYLAGISHSCANVVIQHDSGVGNDLIMQKPHLWISQTCTHTFYLHHACKKGAYTSLE